MKGVVGTGRFELPTCRLGGDRSIHLSYVPDALIVPAFQTLLRNVATIMHAVKMNLPDPFIDISNRRGKVGPRRGNSQHPPAGSLQTACSDSRSRVEHLRRAFLNSDRIPRADLPRIPSRSHHHAYRRIALPSQRARLQFP